MQLTRLAIDDGRDGQGRRIELGALAPGLNVIVNRDERGADLVGLADTLLWGSPGGAPLGPLTREPVSGSLELYSSAGPYRLRRQWQNGQGQTGQARHTFARLDSQPATGDDIPRLLHGLSPRILATVFGGDFRLRPQLAELLSAEAASQFRRVEANAPQPGILRHAPPSRTAESSTEIFARRDEVARNVEQRLAERRGASNRLEAELADRTRQLSSLDSQHAALSDRLQALQAELSTLDARVRYTEIAHAARQAEEGAHESVGVRRTDALDAQIDRWRATLGELEQRHSQVLAQLSQVHPHESSLAASVVDQRACLAVIDRLMRDLEAEVSRFARTNTSWACMCRDAHPRLNPLVETLGRQYARLTQLVQHHERAAEVRELATEAEDLERSRNELRQQLEHLLQRRQDALRSGRPRREEPAGAELEARSLVTGDPRTRRLELQREEADLLRQRDALDAQRAQLRHQHDELLRQRNEILRDPGLAALQRELEHLQAQLDRSLSTAQPQGAQQHSWRASDVLAKLTDGRITALHLRDHGRSLEAQELSGRRIPLFEMSAELQDLAYLALKLAMVDAYACHNVKFPLLLIEPFARLADAPSRVLAGVLADLAQRGRQVVVATANRSALERFQSLGATLHEPNATTRPAPLPIPTPHFEPEAAPALVRKIITTADSYYLRPEDPIDRFPVPLADRTSAFARARIRTVGDLLAADPDTVSQELRDSSVSPELVSLWQLHAGLVAFVPGLSLADAQLLTELGVYEPHELAQRTAAELVEASRNLSERFPDGRWRDHLARFTPRQAEEWITAARNELPRLERDPISQAWRRHANRRREGNRSPRHHENHSGRTTLKLRSAPATSRSSRSDSDASRNDSSRSESSRRERPDRQRTLVKGGRTTHPREAREPRETREPRERRPRFYLELGSDIEKAPSIGSKMAEQLNRCGVRTVADLLAADGGSLAAELAVATVSGETIVAWQHQARLVCRIPELRGHDAQILVACGFSIPEEIATMKPAELLGFVNYYCNTSEGQRVLRNSPAPDLKEVTGWIEQARHCRALGAA